MPTAKLLPLVIVDDCPLFLDGLSACLVRHEVQIVSRCESLEAAKRIVDESAVALVILGPHLDEAAAFGFCRGVHRMDVSTRLLMYSMEATKLQIRIDAAYVGVAACLPPNLDCEDSITAIRMAVCGYQMLPQEALWLESMTNTLTGQERRILQRLIPGKTYAQIARELDLQLPTVRNHVQHILEKLDAHNRDDATRRAVRRGWLEDSSGCEQTIHKILE